LKILVIDNYDSFTWNLVQILSQWGNAIIDVVKNDMIRVSHAIDYNGIVLSPGPGIPSEAGITCDIIREYAQTKSILGVCLGCQAIAEVFGGRLHNMNEVRHGMEVKLEFDKDELLFKGIDQEISAGLYHSWAISEEHLPSCLEVTARSNEGIIMALKHKEFDLRGVQFHPESIMTKQGPGMIWNWMEHVSQRVDGKK
jgi:anthranilate synthase component II